MKIIFFPHAGGSSIYYNFLKQHIFRNIEEVQIYEYPGRFSRSQENPFQSWKESVRSIAKELAESNEKEFVLMGYSMGGYIAYEVSLLLKYYYNLPPQLVIISSQGAPQEYEPLLQECKTEEQLRNYVNDMGGIDPKMMEHESAMNYFFNIIRTDLMVLDQFDYQSLGNKVTVPLCVLYGKDDQNIKAEKIDRWAELTENFLGSYSFEGGHFFVQNHKEEFMERVDEIIDVYTKREVNN